MFSLNTIMSTDLITLRPTATLAEARTLMQSNRIHLTNVLAATDSILRDPDSRIHAADVRAQDVMVTEIATIDEHASLRQAALFLEKHNIGCLPVVTDGKLRGIITDTDFVGVAINLLEQIETTEPIDEEYV